MSTKSVKRMFKTFAKFISRNKSSILIGTGIVGFFGSIYECGKASPVAKERLEAKKEELGVDKLPVKEVIKTAGPVYIPTAAMAITSAGCIIGGTRANLRQNAALAAAYTMSEKTLEDYNESVVDVVGEKKEKLIEENVAKKSVQKANLPAVIDDIPGNGQFICVDTYSGRSFKADKNKIQAVINNLNEVLNNDDIVSFNDYLTAFNLAPCDYGEQNGWNRNGGLIEASYTSVLRNDIPCLAVTLSPQPKYKYYNYA